MPRRAAGIGALLALVSASTASSTGGSTPPFMFGGLHAAPRGQLPLPPRAALMRTAPPAAGGGLPRKFTELPFTKMSLTVGHPNDGYQRRAKRLTSTRELFVRKSSRDRAYGYPSLVLMLHRSARDVAKAVAGSMLLVGDLSAKDGGALAGHHSHQSG